MPLRAKRATCVAVSTATFVLLRFLLVHFGSWGLYAFPVLFAALLVFYDRGRN